VIQGFVGSHDRPLDQTGNGVEPDRLVYLGESNMLGPGHMFDTEGGRRTLWALQWTSLMKLELGMSWIGPHFQHTGLCSCY